MNQAPALYQEIDDLRARLKSVSAELDHTNQIALDVMHERDDARAAHASSVTYCAILRAGMNTILRFTREHLADKTPVEYMVDCVQSTARTCLCATE